MNKEINFQQRSIVYRVIGKGKPVMLVHGFGEKSDVWDPIVNILDAEFSFIIPDIPGSGDSPLIDDMSMEGMAEVLNAIIEAESAARENKITMIGHSMGGYITMAFVEKYADRLNGFGLFHSSAFADTEEKKATRNKGIEFIREHGGFEFLKTATPKLFSEVTLDKRPELIDEQIAGLSNFSADALVLYYQAMMDRPDRTGILRSTTIPVLFVMGKYDTAVTPEDMLAQCHLPEKSYIHMLQQSGHMGMLEETEKSARILKEFLLET